MKRGRLPSSSEDSDDNGSKSCFVVLGADQGLGQSVYKHGFLNAVLSVRRPWACQAGRRTASERDTAGLSPHVCATGVSGAFPKHCLWHATVALYEKELNQSQLIIN